MTVAETSLQAFYKKKQEGTLTEDQEKVFQVIKKHGPISCKNTARHMNRFPNEISGRFTELRRKDHIQIHDRENGSRRYLTTEQSETFTCPMCQEEHTNHYRHKEHVKGCFE